MPACPWATAGRRSWVPVRWWTRPAPSWPAWSRVPRAPRTSRWASPRAPSWWTSASWTVRSRPPTESRVPAPAPSPRGSPTSATGCPARTSWWSRSRSSPTTASGRSCPTSSGRACWSSPRAGTVLPTPLSPRTGSPSWPSSAPARTPVPWSPPHRSRASSPPGRSPRRPALRCRRPRSTWSPRRRVRSRPRWSVAPARSGRSARPGPRRTSPACWPCCVAPTPRSRPRNWSPG